MEFRLDDDGRKKTGQLPPSPPPDYLIFADDDDDCWHNSPPTEPTLCVCAVDVLSGLFLEIRWRVSATLMVAVYLPVQSKSSRDERWRERGVKSWVLKLLSKRAR